jgi:hypothetical protein
MQLYFICCTVLAVLPICSYLFLSFRFLASLINPHEPQNTEPQIQIGLSLISCALEVSPQDLLCGICAIIYFL